MLLTMAMAAVLLASAPASARTGRLDGRARSLIRTAISSHFRLLQSRAPLPLPKSKILSDQVAANKKYGDSWTCRGSTCMLIDKMRGKGPALVLDSVGKNAFRWGNEGLVSYHYFGVDNPRRPSVLLDPTAVSNFARDVAPGGMLRGLLAAEGRKRGDPKAAERVTRRIARGGINGLLVLANPNEIAVYKGALEQAARYKSRMQRIQETTLRYEGP